MSAHGCPDCGAIVKVFQGLTVPHECTPICTTPGCRLHRHHPGICAVATPREQGPLMEDARWRAEAHFTRPCTTPGCALITRHEVCIAPMDGGARVSLPTTPCHKGAPYCGRAAGHNGACQMDRTARDLRQGAKRGPYAPGEYTAYPVTVDARGRRVITLWAFVRAACTTPLGAMFGLALLVLLWLSGCA